MKNLKKKDLVFGEMPKDVRFRDLSGRKFSRWTVLGFSHATPNKYWYCECECGTVRAVPANTLASGVSKSCGCLCIELGLRKKHGKSGESIYAIWLGILSRCRNKNNIYYNYYGGRGITVCDRWLKFENFLKDMGDRPNGMSIDRIDVNGNYEKSNCRWATWKEQANNKRTNTFLTFNNKTQTLAMWANETGINAETIAYRLKNKWTIDSALTTAVRGSVDSPLSTHVTYQGEIFSLTELAEKYGLNRGTLSNRLVSGWGIEAAVTTPTGQKPKIITHEQ